MKKSDLHRLFGLNPKTLLLWEKGKISEKRQLLYFALKELTSEQIKRAENRAKLKNQAMFYIP